MTPEEIISIWNVSRNKQRFKTYLRSQGFQIIGCGERSVVLSKKSLDFVVKVSDGVVVRKFREKELEKFRLPYIYVNGNRNIAIQKKVTRRTKASRYRAWAKIRDSVTTLLSDYDIHQDNVGWLNRKPVIFDYK